MTTVRIIVTVACALAAIACLLIGYRQLGRKLKLHVDASNWMTLMESITLWFCAAIYCGIIAVVWTVL